MVALCVVAFTAFNSLTNFHYDWAAHFQGPFQVGISLVKRKGSAIDQGSSFSSQER